jgi:hypothetical protein
MAVVAGAVVEVSPSAVLPGPPGDDGRVDGTPEPEAFPWPPGLTASTMPDAAAAMSTTTATVAMPRPRRASHGTQNQPR